MIHILSSITNLSLTPYVHLCTVATAFFFSFFFPSFKKNDNFGCDKIELQPLPQQPRPFLLSYPCSWEISTRCGQTHLPQVFLSNLSFFDFFLVLASFLAPWIEVLNFGKETKTVEFHPAPIPILRILASKHSSFTLSPQLPLL